MPTGFRGSSKSFIDTFLLCMQALHRAQSYSGVLRHGSSGKILQSTKMLHKCLKQTALCMKLGENVLCRGGSRGGAWGAHAPPFGAEQALNAEV